jgi:excisionase family DNA binding protein
MLTVTEVAAMTGKTERTIANWMRAGKLPVVRLGRRRVRIRRDDAERIVLVAK